MLKKPIQKHELIKFLKVHYAIEASSVQLLPLGADMDALTYKIDTESKSNSYFLKINYGNYEEISLAVIRLLHDANIKEIIFPIAAVDDQLLTKLNHFSMIIYPFIDGHNGFEQKLTKSQWIELGKTLKKIHTLSVPTSIQQQLRKEEFSPKWREMVRSLDLQIERHTSKDKVTTDFQNFYHLNQKAIDQLVNTAEELCKKIQADSNNYNYVLCHTDIHAGNILLTPNGSFYIIDWDNPMMAPKERDLMFIGGGVGNVWNSADEVAYFYQGYGKSNIDKTILLYYRHERIVEDIALYGQDILALNQNESAKLVSLKHFKSMFEPQGVIDIAFSSS